MGEQRERPKRWAEAKGGRRWWKPLVVIWIEWICEWIAYFLSRGAFISILEYLGRLTILLALAWWIVEIPERKQAQEIQRKVKIFQAWQVINTAQSGSGGRHLALRDLIDEGQSLANVDLSQVRLTEPDLSGANLHSANLSEAILFKANLNAAFLWMADLSGAFLGEADLSGAMLSMADLSGANLARAKLSEANFHVADLSGANLIKADLSGADLSEANLIKADLRGAILLSLQGWRSILDLNLANVWDVKNAPDGFLEWAIGEQGAVSVANDYEWKAMLEEQDKWEEDEDDKRVLYRAWKQKWDEEHGNRK